MADTSFNSRKGQFIIKFQIKFNMDLSSQPKIAYVLWAKNQIIAHQIASEAAISILSYRNLDNTQEAQIHCYLTSNYEFFLPFLTWQKCSVSPIVPDNRFSFMTKIKVFLQIARSHDRFWIVDTDTTFRKPIGLPPTDRVISFASHNLPGCLSAMPKSLLPYFSQYFGVKRQFGRVCSCAIFVDKAKNTSFIAKYTKELSSIYDQYVREVENNPAITHTSKMCFFDEWYFTLALLRLNQQPKSFLFKQKHFNSGKSRYINHAQKIALPTLNKYVQIMLDHGINTNFFAYPNRYTKS